MQNLLTVAAIQTDLSWEDPSENLVRFERLIDSIPDPIDLLVLPEMFTTGFTMNPKEVAESMDGVSVAWLRKIALQKQVAVVGSLVIEENHQYYNRALFVHPDGRIETYDKRHLFTLAGEHTVYEKGTQQVIVDYIGWKICPLICYDLRFPVWSRNVFNYDLLLYMANWPAIRIDAWDTLLKARGIENMSYCIGVNRIGQDHNHYEYTGHTSAFDYMGNQIGYTEPSKEEVLVCKLAKDTMIKRRNELQFLHDQDNFKLTLL